MTNFEQLGWRLDLPDDWEPAGFWCVGLTIPAGQQYMDSLTAAVGALTLSKTWARDPTGDGAPTVAHTWENALYMNPFTVQEDCIVISPPPIPDDAAAKDWSAGIIQLFFQGVITHFNTCAPGPGDCAPCVDSLMTALAPYGATDAVRGILARLCQDLNTKTPTERAAYETDCPFIGQFDDLSGKIADNPYDWLNKLSDWLFDWLNSTSDAIMQDLNIAAALLGGNAIGQYVNDHGGAGGGATFGDTCTWVHDFDFTTGQHGWNLRVISEGTLGTYTPGVGFEVVQLAFGGADHKLLEMYIDHGSPINMTDGIVTYDLQVGGLGADFIAADFDGGTNISDMVIIAHDYLSTGTGLTIEGSGSPTYSFLFAEVQVGYRSPSTGDPTGGSGRVSAIHLEGTGADPFAGL